MVDQLYEACIEAVRAAGAIMKSHTGERMSVQFKTSWSDLLTEVDTGVEQAVRAAILARFPDHGFLGEEGGGGWEKEYTWVLDPVDGTTNFAHTLPNFVCSLACYRGREALVGAIYDPSRDELFSARRGEGAWLNGYRIQVDPAAALQESLVATNLLWDLRDDRALNLPGMQEIGRHVRGIRSLGAAALEMAYVACGRLSAYLQWRLSPWDFGAGLLLVTEAGGLVTRVDGSAIDPTQRGSILASNGKIHDEIIGHLRQQRVE
jgi:myo-inositol-1(or 4)-monophosphatase